MKTRMVLVGALLAVVGCSGIISAEDPDGGADAGKAEAGVAGAGGAGASGNGGTGVAASGGSAGSGKAGAGGTAGSGAAGKGGTSGTGGNAGSASCSLSSYLPTNCGACVNFKCLATCDDCASSKQCISLIGCVLKECPKLDMSCIGNGTCVTSYPAGIGKVLPLQDCVTTKCETECGL